MTEMPCAISGCTNPVKATGLCNMHYLRRWRNGHTNLLGVRPLLERIWEKTVVTESGCWLWTGATKDDGYGRIWTGGRLRLVHRVMWELMRGPIAVGMQLDHVRCQVACTNPDHLRLATNGQNQQNSRGAYRNNRLGIRGVYRTRSGRFVAHAQVDGRRHVVGRFDTPGEAASAVTAWRREHMPFSVTDQPITNITREAN